jgi:broad specificity phosphatase PhoE
MTARLILIAHAETQATRAAAFSADEPLTAKGRAAAERLASALPPFVRAWRSPANAALETATAFACDATADPMLADLDCGVWRGRPIADIATADPEGLKAWLADPAYAGHGGQAIATLVERTAGWLETRRAERGVALAISHAAVVRCAVLAVLGAPAEAFWRLDVAPLTRVELSSDGRRWTLRAMTGAVT